MTERERLIQDMMTHLGYTRVRAAYWAAMMVGDDVSDVAYIDDQGHERRLEYRIMPELLEAIKDREKEDKKEK